MSPVVHPRTHTHSHPRQVIKTLAGAAGGLAGQRAWLRATLDIVTMITFDFSFIHPGCIVGTRCTHSPNVTYHAQP